MATTSAGTENPEKGGTTNNSSCDMRAPMMLCCPFMAVFSCMARTFMDCAEAMTRDTRKAG